MWYIKAENMDISRKQMIESLKSLKTMDAFDSAIFMRLFKSGKYKNTIFCNAKKTIINLNSHLLPVGTQYLILSMDNTNALSKR